MKRKEWSWEGIVLVFLGFCAGMVLLSIAGFLAVFAIHIHNTQLP